MKREVDIEIDIFSGRPNPKVTICGPQAERLSDLLHHARTRLKAAQSEDSLGFRGFVVQEKVGDDIGYRVVDGMLFHGETAFADSGRTTETYIFSLLPPDLKSLVRPFLPSSPAP